MSLYEFVLPGQTVNQDFYLQVLRRLREAVRLKRPALWDTGVWWLHHDNAPAHRALRVKQFLVKNGMALLPHPPYSSDLAPCDFCLFPRMKKELKGWRFDDEEEVQKKSKNALKAIITHEFADCFDQWKSRLQRCIQAEGQYFEGDSVD
uniref:Tc1-like transposase DDE domain-containing protein n=1 Tax=Salarias fasciatus TaxID=181472 RepID=A0A672HZ50_SALFA